MSGRALAPVALALLAGLWVCYLTTGSAAEANAPQGFGDETVIDDVPAPTALAFTFDDHLLVASRGNCMCSIRAVRRFLHITGTAFVPDRLSWPGVSDDAYFFGDFVCGRIFELTPDGAGGFTKQQFASGLASGSTAMTFGPDGTGQALYYTTFTGGGQVHRIVPTGG